MSRPSANRQARAFAAGALAAGFQASARAPKLSAKAKTRNARIAELEAREKWATLTAEAWHELRELRYLAFIAGGRSGRRLDRRRKNFVEQLRQYPKGVRPMGDRRPWRADGRISTTLRRAILASEGKPYSGRQWRNLRKRAARADRAGAAA